MGKKIRAVVALPLILLAFPFAGLAALLGGAGMMLAFDKKERQQLALKAAVDSAVRACQ